jgi:hypothetical protein
MQCDSTGHPLVNPGTIASWGLMSGTVPGTVPTNTLITGGIYNSSAPAPTTGQTLPFQLDSSGNLNVNVKAGGGSGGTSSSFSATFPSTGTAAGAEYLSSPPSLTSGQMVALQVTSAGSLHTTVDNTNANGSATSANSSPVVIASDQAAVAVKAASGAFASGSIADLAHGQGTMAASVPVAIASNQSAVPTTSAINQTPTNCSGTITTGGTAQNAFTAQTTLHGFTIANIDTGHNDEVLWISFTTTAAAGTSASYPLPAPTATTYAGFGSFTSPTGFGTNVALSVIGATTGHAWSCTWW